MRFLFCYISTSIVFITESCFHYRNKPSTIENITINRRLFCLQAPLLRGQQRVHGCIWEGTLHVHLQGRGFRTRRDAWEQGRFTVERVELVAKQLTKGSEARKETSSHVNIISPPRSMRYCRGRVNKISRKSNILVRYRGLWIVCRIFKFFCHRLRKAF